MSEEKQQDLECATTQALQKSDTDFIKKKFDKKLPLSEVLQHVPWFLQ